MPTRGHWSKFVNPASLRLLPQSYEWYRAPHLPHCLADSGVRLSNPPQQWQDPVAASRPSMSGATAGGWAARLFGRPEAIVSSGEDMSTRTRAVGGRPSPHLQTTVGRVEDLQNLKTGRRSSISFLSENVERRYFMTSHQ